MNAAMPQPQYDDDDIMPEEIKAQLESMFDAVGIDELEALLRTRISGYLDSRTIINGRQRKGSYKLLSEATGVSDTYIWQFHKQERAICITNMNLLAQHFDIRYVVYNFEPSA